MQHADRNVVLADLGENVMYLMGFSFVLGSLFTIFILVMLELIRRRNLDKQA